MKKAIVFIFTAVISFQLSAQDELINLQKYWHYRYRLVHYYMVVGEDAGMSIPADLRNYQEGKIRWGEGPVYLGYYIGVLATEYRLLKDNGQNTDQTLTELYYAIKAAIRLDYVAELSWDQPTNLDGFLIRDDVPGNFLQNHFAELNLNINANTGITTGYGKPGYVTAMSSDYYQNYLQNTREDNAVSQDVIYQLLMGFALVTCCVENQPLSFNNYVTNTIMQVNLRSLASAEADRIIMNIKENNCSPAPDNHWVIKDPDCEDVIGPGADFLSYGIARAGNYITGIDYTDTYEESYEPLWQYLQEPSHLLCRTIGDNWSVHAMAMTLSAMSNAWKENAVNTTPNQIIANGDYNADSQQPCVHPANHYGWDVFYGALWDLFHGGPNNYISDLCKAKQILNSAPYEGPYFHNETDFAPQGWAATRRFFDDSPRQDIGKEFFEGNANGLDYMLLFNLYYLDSKKQAEINYAPIYIPQSGNPVISDHYPYIAVSPDCPNGCPTGNYADNEEIFSPLYPVVATQLAVNAPYFQSAGYLRIYGGVQGVWLTNTTVENSAYLSVQNTSEYCIPFQNYYFDPTSYHLRLASTEACANDISNELPLYNISKEFKIKPVDSSLLIYPTPANNSIYIQYSLDTECDAKIYISDMLGNKILFVIDTKGHSAGTFTTIVNTYGLPAGAYNCIMISGDSQPAIKKFIINH